MWKIYRSLLISVLCIRACLSIRNVTIRQNIEAKDLISTPAGTVRLLTYSKLSCCAIGLETDSVSIFFNSETNICQLNSAKINMSSGSGVTSEQGWGMFVLKDVSCPSNYVFNVDAGICFKIYSSNPTFNDYTDFQSSCRNDGAAPLLVDSAIKHTAIRNYVDLDKSSYSDYLLIQGQRFSYIFVDDNGDELAYADWDRNEPGIYELYLAIAKVYNYKFHDVTHQLSYSDYICEIKV